MQADFSGLIENVFESPYGAGNGRIMVYGAYIDRGEVRLIVSTDGGPLYTTSPEGLKPCTP